MNYSLIKNKRIKAGNTEIFNIQIIWKENLIPTEVQIKDIIEKENIQETLESVLNLPDGYLKIISVKLNFFRTYDKTNIKYFLKKASIQKEKREQILIRKGDVVSLKDGRVGKIIKNSSNTEIYLKLFTEVQDEKEEIKISKSDILKIEEEGTKWS